MARAKNPRANEPKVAPVSASVEEPMAEEPPPAQPQVAVLAEISDPWTKLILPAEEEFASFNPKAYALRGLTEGLESGNSSKTIFAKEIADNGGIAKLAAQLAREEVGDAESRVLKATYLALLHLEVQEYALADLRKFGDIESGLEKCRQAWDARKRKPIPYSYKTDASGKPLPVAFEEGLKVLMQHDAKERRLPYFRQWLADDCLQQLRAEIAAFEKQADNEGLSIRKHTEAVAFLIKKRRQADRLRKDSRQLLIKVVERKIREMRRSGIDARAFERARLTFGDWKARKVSEARSASGTKGAEKTNAKPKRKRAARPPYVGKELEEIFEVAKKSALT
jgi:hypothetical protein